MPVFTCTEVRENSSLLAADGVQWVPQQVCAFGYQLSLTETFSYRCKGITFNY